MLDIMIEHDRELLKKESAERYSSERMICWYEGKILGREKMVESLKVIISDFEGRRKMKTFLVKWRCGRSFSSGVDHIDAMDKDDAVNRFYACVSGLQVLSVERCK